MGLLLPQKQKNHPFPTSPLLSYETEMTPACASPGRVSPGGVPLRAPAAFLPLTFLETWSSSIW